MKTAAIKKLREKLAANQTVYGLWVTLDSASVTEMAVGLGLDWIVIDAEHGHLDWSDIVAHVRATVRSDTVVLVRVAELGIGLVKRVLDIGADGVVIPWIETTEQLEQAVSFSRYPPRGVRGIGGERATCWGGCFTENISEADENVLVVPIVESVKGGKNIADLCRVPGVDLFFVGPADYSSTAGFPGQWEGPGVAEDLLRIKDEVRRAGKHCGIVSTGHDDAALRREQGFSLIALGLDGGLLLRTLTESLAQAGMARRIVPSFVPENKPDGTKAAPATTRPPEMQPDRGEVITRLEDAAQIELERGVLFRPLVGKHNGARNLTTGLVTFAPGAELPYHTHTFSESVTVLEGRVFLEAEGRRYNLGELDNVVIPHGVAHYVVNAARDPATLHIAMPTENPTRVLATRFFSSRAMPPNSVGQSGAELVNPHAFTPFYEPNPGARFQDFFNRELGCPEMSGGYGIFAPGAQLPCHIHDFDESICIVQGSATCVVEGKRYTLSGGATALVPRGRCHYFINETQAPMAMLWVYAGPMPERMVMEATLCNLAWD